MPHSRFPDDLPPIVPAFESASGADRTASPGIEVPILWVSEPTGECSFLSDSWYEFTGFAPGAGLGDGWADAIHPDDRAAAYDGFTCAARERGPVRLEYRLRRPDGSYRWVVDAAAARFDADGAFRGYLGFIVDIHDLGAAFGRVDLGLGSTFEDVEEVGRLIEAKQPAELRCRLERGRPSRVEGDHQESGEDDEAGLARAIGHRHRMQMLLNLVDGLPGRGQRAAELEQELLQRLVVYR